MIDLAKRHSMSCFFNSLLREWPRHKLVQTHMAKELHLPLSDDSRLILPLLRHSALGRHQYTGSIYLEAGDGARHELDFSQALPLVLQSLSQEFKSTAAQAQAFEERVHSSWTFIADALEYRARHAPIPEKLGQYDFLAAEQALLIGHNFHPTPKSHDRMLATEYPRCTPEFAGALRLEWFLVHPSVHLKRQAQNFDPTDWLSQLMRQEVDLSPEMELKLSEGYRPFPVHPWQMQVLLRHPLISRYHKTGRFIHIGSSRKTWAPTSSMRTVYKQESTYMMKFSMSVKLTNSVRHLLLREVERGLQLYDVLQTEKGHSFQQQNSNFHILGEPAYLALLDENFHGISESLVVLRNNPFGTDNVAHHLVLATLLQDAPYGGPSLLQQALAQMPVGMDPTVRAQTWLRAFLNVAVRPLLLAQANLGVLLGAHQQNLILSLREGLPVKAYFRDCQGTGYSELGYRLFSPFVKSIQRDNGNVLDPTMGNSLFAYYLVLNSTFNVIATLAQSQGVKEAHLLAQLREFLLDVRCSGVTDPSCLDYLLNDSALRYKGNFFCSLRNLNENTTDDPLAIYTKIENLILPEALC